MRAARHPATALLAARLEHQLPRSGRSVSYGAGPFPGEAGERGSAGVGCTLYQALLVPCNFAPPKTKNILGEAILGEVLGARQNIFLRN